jgi:hypothetical protein
MRYSDNLTPEIIVSAEREMQTGPKDWLVWLNVEDRTEFMRKKQDIMPSSTNPQFINALLKAHEFHNAVLENDYQPITEPKLWPQIKKNGVLQRQIVTYRNSAKVVKKKAPVRQSYKINGIELLESEDCIKGL